MTCGEKNKMETKCMTNLLVKPLAAMLLFSGAGMAAATCIDPSQMPSSTPDERFDDLGNGTIRDKVTGLMWKKCIQGLSGADCTTGAAIKKSWKDALQDASSENFAGHDDWRLPNKNELFSIVESRCANPSINENIFPNVGSVNHWTSTPVYEHDTAEKAVRVYFANGDTNTSSINGAGREEMFRLVRGGR